MAKTKISQYDATAANNTDIDSINIAEGMAPSNVNNAIRELMAHLKDMDAGTQALTSPQLTSADINGGTIDGVTIGGASAGAGTFTTLTANTSITGTLATAAQTNITSVGTLTSLDVGGTVTADGLTVDGNGQINQTAGNASTLTFTSNGQASRYSRIKVDTDRSLILTAGVGAVNETPDIKLQTGTATGEKDRILIDGATGDISFYEDTGTTPKFFWDASEERLGIGTSSPSTSLHVSTSAENVATFASTDTGARIVITDGTDTGYVNVSSGKVSLGQTLGLSASNLNITSTGSVGIGTTSPEVLSHLKSSDNTIFQLESTTPTVYMKMVDSNTTGAGYIGYVTNDMTFWANNSEAMRIDSSGNLLVGTTDTNPVTNNVNGSSFLSAGGIRISRTGEAAGFNRKGSDGTIIDLRKDGATVGSIGNRFGAMYVHSPDGTNGAGLRFFDGVIQPCESNGNDSDNDTDLGQINSRFDDIYATNGTIQTSDRNEKQDIAELSDAEQRVAVAAKGLLRKFRWKSAVEAKGDEARTHFGIIAQDLQAAFAAEGLDAGDYAMFISSTWTDEETGEERTRMGVRYSELLAFIIAAI